MENLWKDGDAKAAIASHAKKGIGEDLGLRVYTTRLLGGEPRLVLHGGGNTSVKTMMTDLLGEQVEAICVKGSGADMASIEPAGLPALRLGRLRKLRAYANVSLLCIDEVGYLSFDDKFADLLYEVINQRYEQKSLILTTNKPFKEWNEVFPNAACIATMLDRLLHHAEVTVIEGSSYRVRESEQEASARRRRKK